MQKIEIRAETLAELCTVEAEYDTTQALRIAVGTLEGVDVVKDIDHINALIAGLLVKYYGSVKSALDAVCFKIAVKEAQNDT